MSVASKIRQKATQGWESARRDAAEQTVAYFTELAADHPGHPIALFHLARSHDYAGHPATAAPLYERAFAAGLDGEERHTARISYASTLRNLHRADEAVDVLAEARHERPEDPLIACYLALALTSAHKATPAVALLLDTIVHHITDETVQNGRWALTKYTQALRYGYWSPHPNAPATPAAPERADNPTTPPTASPQSERMLLDYMLDTNRRALINSVQGLSETDARQRLVPSLTTPISLIKHAAGAERIWFQRFWAGLDEADCDGYSRRDEGTFTVSDDETLDDVIAEFERASQRSRDITAHIDLDDTKTNPREGTVTLRWTLIAMIQEFARHAGHADILREQIDGQTRSVPATSAASLT